MTDDLTTLLRDAGREPTIDLDVDAVHSRGRRRAVGRRVAAGAGALALLGVLGAGVATLLDTPEAPMIDQAPAEDAVPVEDTTPDGEPDEGTAEGADAEARDQELAASLGVTTHRFAAEDAGTRIVLGTADGGYGRVAEAAAPDAALDRAASLAVTAAGDVWWEDGQGALPVLPAGEAQTPQVGAEGEFGGGVSWRVLGHDGRGEILLGRLTSTETGEEFSIVRTDGDAVGEVLAGLDVLAAIEGDGTPVRAVGSADRPEEVWVLDAIGESYAVTHMPQGGAPTTLLEVGGIDHWLAGLAVVGDDLWALEAGIDGVVDVLVLPLDGGGLWRVATPVGREFDGYVLDLTVAQGPDGPVGMLSAASEDGTVRSWSVDTGAVRAAAVPSEPMASEPALDIATGFSPVDLPGRVLVTTPLPDTGSDAPLAACATDEGLVLNEKPAFPAGRAWYLCWDAMARVSDGVEHPLVATELFTGGDSREVDAAGLEALLRAWAEGPPPRAAEAGLSGGLDGEVGSIQDVAVVDGRVVVDILGGSQVGVLGTTTGRATFVQQVAGMVFQFDGHDALEIHLDGSCEAWTDLADVDPGCEVYDESVAPWNQAVPGTVGGEQDAP